MWTVAPSPGHHLPLLGWTAGQKNGSYCLSFFILFCFYISFFIVCTCTQACQAHMRRQRKASLLLVLSVPHIGSRDWTQAMRISDKCLYLLSYLVTLILPSFFSSFLSFLSSFFLPLLFQHIAQAGLELSVPCPKFPMSWNNRCVLPWLLKKVQMCEYTKHQ